MTEDKSHIKLSNLLYSCVDQKQRGSEQIVSEHSMGYIISGQMQMQTNHGVIVWQKERLE